MSAGATFEDTIRGIVRDVVREEVREALAAARTRNAPDRDGIDGYMSIAKAAAFADVAPGTLRRWIHEGRVTGRRAGRDLRVSRAELERFLANPAASPDVQARARKIARAA